MLCIEKNGFGMILLYKICYLLDKNGRGTFCVDFSKYFLFLKFFKENNIKRMKVL